MFKKTLFGGACLLPLIAIVLMGATFAPAPLELALIVPIDTEIVPGIGGDRIIITGPSTGVATVGCSTGEHPVYNAIVIDPGEGRANRVVGVVSVNGELRPGTRLDILDTSSCSATQMALLTSPH